MSKYAPKRDDGMAPYVVTKSSWGKSWDRIIYAPNLAIAKREYGWTSMQHTSITVRRATPADMLTDGERGVR